MNGPARQYALLPLDTAIQEAIGFLRQNEPPEGYFVGFSGGKDSIVTLELCRMAGVRHQAYYSCTMIDPPEVVKFIRQYYPNVSWLYPKLKFWEGIRRYGPPLRYARWCCTTLKKNPSKQIPLANRVMGIRAEESKERAAQPRIGYIEKRKQFIFKPIFNWMEWMIWDFIEGFSLPYPKLYEEGFDRIGCVVCPYVLHKNQSRLNQRRNRWPMMYKVFEHACRSWFESGRVDKSYPTFDLFLEAYYRGFETHKVAKVFREDQERLVPAA